MLLRFIIGTVCVLLYLPLAFMTFPEVSSALSYGIDAWSLLVLSVYLAWIGGLLFGGWLLITAFILFMKSGRVV